MRTSAALRATRLLAIAVAASLFPVQAMAQTNNFVVEAPIDAIPLDLEVAPNGKVAVVRGNIPGDATANDQKLSIWRTDIGAQVLPTQANAVGQGNLILHPTSAVTMFSDALAVTNSRVVAIGSADTDSNGYEDTTYVDILELRYVGGVPQPIILATHGLFASNPTPRTVMGRAHDVAITPDGSMALVSHDNWVHSFELSAGALVGAINIGSLGPAGPSAATTPYSSRNSVAVTDTRAVVTAGRLVSGGVTDTDVFLLDLSIDPPVVRLHDTLPRPVGWESDLGPHDIAITPDGLRAVVTASGYVALYDLTNYARLGNPYVDTQDTRRWGYSVGSNVIADLWDSVEVSNSRAVVLANRWTGELSSGSRNGWGVAVFDISSTLGQPLWAVEDTNAQDTVWDVALAPDAVMATVKTELHDVALLDLANPGLASFLKVGPSPYQTNHTLSSGTPGINDATALLAPTGSDPYNQKRWAVFNGLLGPNQVGMRFYDLAAGSWNIGDPSVISAPLVETGSPTNLLDAADLAVASSGTDLMVRLTAPMDDNATAGGVDWTRWGGDPPDEVTPSWGGRGICVGADSLKLGRGKSVSISWDHESTSIPAGFIHIITIQ